MVGEDHHCGCASKKMPKSYNAPDIGRDDGRAWIAMNQTQVVEGMDGTSGNECTWY
ncbi:hypothetical protein Scep_012161 [Stephania cephalantha]|uniref:Uncharacterized protein n=1 Tax=Stephania cephalantha TaxID=152367 RepID=A0AAP0JGF5_9MAGN